MVYVYNLLAAPQSYGSTVVLPPLNYKAVDDATAIKMKEAGFSILIETDPTFPHLWVRHNPAKMPKRESP